MFCGKCVTEKVIPRRLRFIDPVKMCTKCQKISRWENDYFDNYQPKMRKGEEVEVEGGEGRRRGVVGIPGDGAILNISYPEGPAIPILLDEVGCCCCMFYCLSTFPNTAKPHCDL